MRGIEQIPWAYDLFMEVAERTGLRRWRRLVTAANGRTLDLGCGTGRNLRLFDARLQVIGLEPDLRLLVRARHRAPGIPLVSARSEQLPFRSGTFETVVSSLVFCTVQDPVGGLAEVKRVLTGDGRLRMLEHGRAGDPRWARLQDLIQPLWTRLAGGCHPNRHPERNVERAGFVIDGHRLSRRTTLRCFVARPAGTPPAVR